MILIRLRRSLPAIVASTGRPASSSIENIPALNFSTTLPITSIASSFGKFSSTFPFDLGLLPNRRYAVERRPLLTTPFGPHLPCRPPADSHAAPKIVFHRFSLSEVAEKSVGAGSDEGGWAELSNDAKTSGPLGYTPILTRNGPRRVEYPSAIAGARFTRGHNHELTLLAGRQFIRVPLSTPVVDHVGIGAIESIRVRPLHGHTLHSHPVSMGAHAPEGLNASQVHPRLYRRSA